jgi:hypothetical protein
MVEKDQSGGVSSVLVLTRAVLSRRLMLVSETRLQKTRLEEDQGAYVHHHLSLFWVSPFWSFV